MEEFEKKFLLKVFDKVDKITDGLLTLFLLISVILLITLFTGIHQLTPT